MDKRIVINRGDEYRFKTEKEPKEEDFFYEVYQKAESVTEEILETMRQRREQLYRTKAHFYGVGNNIIVFCGSRGEGKTSALQSFAYQLKNAENKEYVVLDTIDPSELDSEQSIVRVFLSRLFSCFQSLYDKSDKFDNDNDEREMNRERKNILDKFNKCYNNLTYIRQKGKKDIYQDNLDYLSELGDSRNLRTNLFLLVEMILEYKQKYCSGTSQSLVVPIDDADLSMGDIFKNCEDIRNYFSIPNAVVLMAADFEQLRNAIYQRYLKHFKTILKNDKKLKYKNKCYLMAAKFMEKMFPNGHRIELPNINHEIQRNANSIRLEYKENIKGRKDRETGYKYNDVFPEKEWENCNDIQEQLIKSLYVRTGIILEKRYDMQVFLPHTLRELTHFLKLLDSMEVVDFEEAVFEGVRETSKKTEDDKPNLLRWKNNLEELKRYYLRYWLQNYLKNEQTQLVKGMDKVNQYDNVDQMSKLILAYIEENKKKNDVEEIDTKDIKNDFASLLYDIIRKSKVLKQKLQDAIYIYFSIVLNSDFVQELILHKDMSEFVAYIKKPLYYDMAKKDSLEYFSFKVDRYKKYAEKDPEMKKVHYQQLFCTDASFMQSEGKSREEEREDMHFNVWGAILQIFVNSDLLNTDFDSVAVSSGEGDSLADERPEDGNQIGQEESKYRADLLISAKNIVCNLEVRFHIERAIKKCLASRKEKNTAVPIQLYAELFKKVDGAINDRKYLGIQANIGSFLEEKLRGYGTLFWCSYLSNEEYGKQYLNSMKKDIDSLITESKHDVNILKELSCKDEAGIERFRDQVAQKAADVGSKTPKYPLLEGVAIQNTDFDILQTAQKDIRQEWNSFSEKVKEAITLEEKQAAEMLSEFKSALKLIEKGIESQENEEMQPVYTKTADTEEATGETVQKTTSEEVTIEDGTFRTGKS